MAQLSEVTLFARHLAEVQARYPGLGERKLVHETVRRMINALVQDLCRQSGENISAANPALISDVRSSGALIAFSDDMQQQQRELKQFLRTNLYRHYRVNRMSSKAQRIIRELFTVFDEDPSLMPDDFQARAKEGKPRAVADYIAGMTDRYAIREYRRLFTVEEQPL